MCKDFDPEYALAVPQVAVPFPNEFPLNNLSECRQLLPSRGTVVKHLKVGSKHHAAAPTAAPEAASAQNNALAAGMQHPTLSQQWSQSFQDGPLGLLSKWKRKRVRVLVRRQHGLRGWYEGQLQLFDRHWNMLLLEVTEHAVDLQPDVLELPLRSEQNLALSACWKQQHVNQLLLRGDSVVSVCPLPPRGSWPTPVASFAFQSVAATAALAGFREYQANTQSLAQEEYEADTIVTAAPRDAISVGAISTGDISADEALPKPPQSISKPHKPLESLGSAVPADIATYLGQG
eukprot:CAMPEP_0119330416 /NCGR_PEP_ID=MMETSP1333-20130426/78216_1 /TAXON_ID=418940 /ORGANISM="Scyphosphaera apsteinii, Strain RCC1455" /LENGTH=289 /DNA_ID=CAMNT_0007339801 /DNA_START=276 /DNA_END=1145 /DNA_ORIENTATION=-